MKLWLGFFAGFVFGSASLFAQTPLLDFGAIPDIQKRSEIQQWWVEKEIRNGSNPFMQKPCQ